MRGIVSSFIEQHIATYNRTLSYDVKVFHTQLVATYNGKLKRFKDKTCKTTTFKALITLLNLLFLCQYTVDYCTIDINILKAL